MINIYLLCAATPMESFGQIGLELARHFVRSGTDANVISYNRHCADQDDELKAITRQRIKSAPGGIMLGYPTGYERHCAKPGPKIAITMFEYTRLPPGWVEVLNTLDAVVTPCQFCKDLFIEHGVTVPIHVISLGINPLYQDAERSADRPFTYYACLDRGKRKGGWLALKAFRAAFGDDPNYRLILKKRATGLPLTIDYPNVTLIQQDMSAEELHRLYLQCDVCVNPNYGEGFGLIPRESAASGCITLATNWSGTADDIGLWGVPLPYTLVPADVEKTGQLAGLDLGMWAQPNFDELVALLKDVERYRETYREEARESARRIRGLYSWEKFARGVIEVWKGIGN
jgi:glycosyltransferase involved in cell wall biosynthesis